MKKTLISIAVLGMVVSGSAMAGPWVSPAGQATINSNVTGGSYAGSSLNLGGGSGTASASSLMHTSTQSNTDGSRHLGGASGARVSGDVQSVYDAKTSAHVTGNQGATATGTFGIQSLTTVNRKVVDGGGDGSTSTADVTLTNYLSTGMTGNQPLVGGSTVTNTNGGYHSGAKLVTDGTVDAAGRAYADSYGTYESNAGVTTGADTTQFVKDTQHGVNGWNDFNFGTMFIGGSTGAQATMTQ